MSEMAMAESNHDVEDIYSCLTNQVSCCNTWLKAGLSELELSWAVVGLALLTLLKASSKLQKMNSGKTW